ncbi:MAG: acyl carrier protein [Kiritimatiellae bacterium]|jgi:acyl carrier protein|nr:acyl carrier protein [Kiritimatiellia bacterium]
MTKEDVISKLAEVMKSVSQEDVDWDSISADTKIESLGFDSLSILDLMYDIQQEFDIEIEGEEIVDIKTIDQLAAFIIEKAA